MTDEVTGITPPAPGGLAAYALGSIAGTGWDAWQRPEPGRPEPGRPEGASPPGRPGHAQGSGSAQDPGYPRDPGSPQGHGYPQGQGYPQDPGSPQGQGYPQDPGYPPRRSSPPPPAPRRPARPGGAPYPERPVHHQHQPSPDTPAGPAHGARARRPGPVRGAQVADVIVLAGLVAGLAYLWQGPHSVRAGTFILASALFVAVAARLALPERRAGMLASRRRYIDVTALAILAIGLLVAGLVLPAPS
ncbi:MAG: DUF3017 domain-containing protein [Streptosporangiaceae bacterium]